MKAHRFVRSPATAFLLQCGLTAVPLFAYHRALLAWMRETGASLGAIAPPLVPPLHAAWEKQLPGLWALPAIAVLGSFVLVAPRLYLDATIPAWRVVVASIGFFLAIGPAVAMIDGPQPRRGETGRRSPIVLPYLKAHLEYAGDVPQVERVGVREFLRKFPKRRFFERLSLHTRTHPPGGVLFHYAVAKLAGPGVWPAAVATIAFSALTVPLVYLLARELYGDAAARPAVGLFLVVPNHVMFTTTSMDGPFSVFAVLACLLLLRAATRNGRGPSRGLCLGLALAAGSFMTYAVPAFLAVFFVALLALWRRADPDRVRPAVAALAWAAAAVAAAYAVLWLTSGYHPAAAVAAAIGHDAAMMGTGYETLGRYLHLSVGNLAAFAIGIGLAVLVLWLRRLADTLRARRKDPFLWALTLAPTALAFSTLFTLEVERIWIFMVPLLAAAVAPAFAGPASDAHRRLLFQTAVAVSATQLGAFEALLRTGW